MSGVLNSVAALGALFLQFVSALGGFALLLAKILARTAAILKRPRLIAAQVHFLGNHSLAIILVAGLFVGLVLGLQGYYLSLIHI